MGQWSIVNCSCHDNNIGERVDAVQHLRPGIEWACQYNPSGMDHEPMFQRNHDAHDGSGGVL